MFQKLQIAERLNVSPTIIKNHLKCLELVKKLNVWIQHELKEIRLIQLINFRDVYLKYNETESLS